jgi:hypothetical protein
VKLLDQVRHVARLRRLALETERCYVRWVEQYIRFHKTAEGFRHPNRMGADEIERFLTFLAVQRRVSASTQNQAFAALLFCTATYSTSTSAPSTPSVPAAPGACPSS